MNNTYGNGKGNGNGKGKTTTFFFLLPPESSKSGKSFFNFFKIFFLMRSGLTWSGIRIKLSTTIVRIKSAEVLRLEDKAIELFQMIMLSNDEIVVIFTNTNNFMDWFKWKVLSKWLTIVTSEHFWQRFAFTVKNLSFIYSARAKWF